MKSRASRLILFRASSSSPSSSSSSSRRHLFSLRAQNNRFKSAPTSSCPSSAAPLAASTLLSTSSSSSSASSFSLFSCAYRKMSSSSSVHTIIERAFDFTHFVVLPLPLFSDNYAYLLIDKSTKAALLVDPASASDIQQQVQDLASSANPVLKRLGLQDFVIKGILTTHKHADHAGGNAELLEANPSWQIYGGKHDAVEACNSPVDEGDVISFNTLRIRVLFTPCHTRGHVCYYVTHQSQDNSSSALAKAEEDEQKKQGLTSAFTNGCVFTGDTLFIAGAGKFFEGSGEEMHENLNVKLASLPVKTTIFCGHEYTVSNLQYAKWLEPSNERISNKLKWSEEQRAAKLTTLATTIQEEQAINPFMRIEVPEVQEKVKNYVKGVPSSSSSSSSTAVAIMTAVRAVKDAKAHTLAAH